MPCDYKKYHPEWKSRIRPDILKRAGNCCEECGVLNGSVGARDLKGNFHTESYMDGLNSDCGFSLFGYEVPKIIKIVLTISHTDHDVNNNEYDNLKALCQKCHLNHDKDHHQKTRKKTKYKNSMFPL